MAVISIVGTSGVGKSFLVKQLAAMDCAPAFFEGEEGTIPDEIWKSIFAGTPLKTCKWFVGTYRKRLERARAISKLGIDCYVDGSSMSAKAIILFEDKRYHARLKKMISCLDSYPSDKILLLTLSKEKLREFIMDRGRKSETVEASEKAFVRAWTIQGYFRKVAKKTKNVLVLDRSDLDFSKEKDLKKVKALLSAFR